MAERPAARCNSRSNGTDYGGPVGLQDGLAQLTTSELPAGQHSVAAFFSSSSTAFGNSDNGTAAVIAGGDPGAADGDGERPAGALRFASPQR